MTHYLATVGGRVHARQMSGTERKAWLSELQRNRSRTLDASSWLRRAVVNLMASHEAAYLEHCNCYGLQPTLG